MGKGSAETELHVAARSGDLNAVESILTTNPLLVNSRDSHSRTPLHLAAWSGQAEVVNYLCRQNADVGAAAMDDMGAIHFAAQKGHLEVVKTLISSGVSVKASTRKGLTPLHYAVQGSHTDLIKYLVKKGASLSMKTKAGKTPLDLAKTDEIRSLLEECEQPMKNENLKGKERPKDSASKTSMHNELDNSASPAGEEVEDERAKRKGEKDDKSKEDFPEQKRARVSLSHLSSVDDTEEGETI